MSYEERLKKLLENDDVFWYDAINNFVKTIYSDKEKGISDLEKLATDREKFNEFAKQVIQKKDDLKKVYKAFLEEFDTDSLINDEVKDNSVIRDCLFCLCGNVLQITWSKEEKVKKAICLKCGAEIKLKNPRI